MEAVERLMSTSPSVHKLEQKLLAFCIDACVERQLACADACLGESDVAELRRCLRPNLDCAEICGATGTVIARALDADLELIRAQVEACARACATCGAECSGHAEKHELCRICAEQCRNCEDACPQLLRGLPGTA